MRLDFTSWQPVVSNSALQNISQESCINYEFAYIGVVFCHRLVYAEAHVNLILQVYFTGTRTILGLPPRIAPVPVKLLWRIGLNESHECTKNWWYNCNKIRLSKSVCIFHACDMVFKLYNIDIDFMLLSHNSTSNGSWCIGIKGEMSGTVCVTFTWDIYIYELFIAFVCFVVCSLL